MATGQGINELRLRVEGSFTASELKELARKWGLSPEPSWERSTSDLVRGLLKDAERMFGQSELVRRLRTEKPLVEWPDVESKDAEKWGPKSVTQLGLAPPPSIPAKTIADGSSAGMSLDEATEVRAPDLGSLDVPSSGPASGPDALTPLSPPATVPDVLPEEPAPASVGTPVSVAAPPSVGAPSSAGPSSVPPSSGVRPLSPFPGTVAPGVAPPKAGLDPKILIVVASLMLGLGVVAFAAGLLWSRRGAPTPPTNTTTAAPTVRTNGVAGRALQVLDDALLGVATRCEVDVEGPPSSEILASAQEGCGRSVRESRRRIADPDLPASPDAPRPRPRETPTADDARPIRTPGGAPPTRSTCVTACASVHASCMEGCGAEPSDASKFDVWQACSGRCLAGESRCRLSCR